MKYVYEFIGTFFLVLTVGMAVLNPNSLGNFAPLAIGSALAVMVYATGYLSGGHLNPAVSLAVYLRGRLSCKDLGFYWIFQILGGVAAAFTAIYLKGGKAATPMHLGMEALLAEFLFTFALCFVVLNTATTKANEGNSFYGFAIGFTVLVGAYSVGAISSGAFNPAVALSSCIMNLNAWSNLWIFVVGNFAGAIVAGLLYNAVHNEKGNYWN